MLIGGNMRITLRLACIIAAAAVSSYAGPLSFSFTSSLLTAAQGQTVTFSATLVNTGATPLFLNGDNVNIAMPLIVNDIKFFFNTPPLLAPSQSVTAPILDVTVPPATAFGLYAGMFEVLGGVTPSEFTTLASQTF